MTRLYSGLLLRSVYAPDHLGASCSIVVPRRVHVAYAAHHHCFWTIKCQSMTSSTLVPHRKPADHVCTSRPHAGAFQAHMCSKKHLKAAKRSGCGQDQEEQLARVVWADAIARNDEGGETHAERRVRLFEVCVTNSPAAQVANCNCTLSSHACSEKLGFKFRYGAVRPNRAWTHANVRAALDVRLPRPARPGFDEGSKLCRRIGKRHEPAHKRARESSFRVTAAALPRRKQQNARRRQRPARSRKVSLGGGSAWRRTVLPRL